MIDSIINGFNSFMSFIGDIFGGLLDLLLKPLTLLFTFLDGVFYFIIKLFEVIGSIITLFVRLFQFIFALGGSVLRNMDLVGSLQSQSYSMNHSGYKQGFDFLIDMIGSTGLLTVVPSVLTALLYILFVMKVHKLFSGGVSS